MKAMYLYVIHSLNDVDDFMTPVVIFVGETRLLLTSFVGEVDIHLIKSPDPMSDRGEGDLESFVSLAKIPFLGSHWKYLIPPTEPSFLPEVISNKER